jgi:hypothetical protein
MTARLQILQDDVHRIIRDHFLNTIGKQGKYESLVASLAAKIPVSERHFLRFLGIGGQSWPRKGDFFADLDNAGFNEMIKSAHLVSGYTKQEARELAKKFCVAGKVPNSRLNVPIIGNSFWRSVSQQIFVRAREFRAVRKLIDHPDNRVTLIQLAGVPDCGRSRMLGESCSVSNRVRFTCSIILWVVR